MFEESLDIKRIIYSKKTYVTILQVFLLITGVYSSFFFGMMDGLGHSFIPLIDKYTLMAQTAFYTTIIIGGIVLVRLSISSLYNLMKLFFEFISIDFEAEEFESKVARIFCFIIFIPFIIYVLIKVVNLFPEFFYILIASCFYFLVLIIVLLIIFTLGYWIKDHNMSYLKFIRTLIETIYSEKPGTFFAFVTLLLAVTSYFVGKKYIGYLRYAKKEVVIQVNSTYYYTTNEGEKGSKLKERPKSIEANIVIAGHEGLIIFQEGQFSPKLIMWSQIKEINQRLEKDSQKYEARKKDFMLEINFMQKICIVPYANKLFPKVCEGKVISSQGSEVNTN